VHTLIFSIRVFELVYINFSLDIEQIFNVRLEDFIFNNNGLVQYLVRICASSSNFIRCFVSPSDWKEKEIFFSVLYIEMVFEVRSLGGNVNQLIRILSEVALAHMSTDFPCLVRTSTSILVPKENTIFEVLLAITDCQS